MAIDRQKGTCKHCRVKFKKVNNFYLYCESTPECLAAGKEFQLNARIKSALKKVRNDEKEKFAVMKENIKTLSQWKNDLQKEINAIVREIDKGHPCIATGTMEGKRNAGHYIGIGANQTLRFHLENIWNQSEHSNMWKSGDTIRYQEGIIKLYGKCYLDYLNSLQSLKIIKLDIEDIKLAISKSRGILKWLKLQDRIFTTEERLELRKRFNIEIGIYK